MALNKKSIKTTPDTHLNYMAGKSYDVNCPFSRLHMVAASSFFGEPQYYIEGDAKPSPKIVNARSLSDAERKHLAATLDAIDLHDSRSKTSRQLMETAIDAALNADIERTLQFAAELRNEWMIRATPQVIMVRAAMHPAIKDTGLIAKYAPQIMGRLDEVMNQIAYFEGLNGNLKRIPSRLKRAWAARISQAREYELAKYKLVGKQVNIYDAVNLTHANSEAINKLKKGKISLGNDGLETWESIRSAGGTWDAAAKVMNHMALLRNLRNLDAAGVLDNQMLKTLVAGVSEGKQLPFRYYAAYKAVESSGNARLKDALEECMIEALEHCPHFSGRTMSLSDNSGSARGATTSSMGSMQVSSIGNLMGAITARLSDEGHVGIFGDGLETFEVRKRTGLFEELRKAEKLGDNVGHSTENGIWLFFDKAIRTKEHWDNIFVYSDMQAGHGGLYGTNPTQYKDYLWHDRHHIDVAKLIAAYRKQVNPNVNIFLIQVAGYHDALMPEFYKRTYIMGGWSEKILTFAAKMISMQQNPVPVN